MRIFLFAIVAVVVCACSKPAEIQFYQITNGDATLKLSNYGARMIELWVPDRDGGLRDVIWGYDTVEDMLAGDVNSGPVVGRFGNRIAGAKFTLDGVEYVLTPNDGANQLHGGPNGWASKVWMAEPLTDNSIKFTLVSPDGDENYPGEVTVSVTYTLTHSDLDGGSYEVALDYEATTDKATVLNPTSHGYFNLHGTAMVSSLSHIMTINADAFTPTDENLIPTGEIRSVEGTPLDFRQPHVIGERIEEDYEPLVFAKGYDHNWVLGGEFAAEVYEPATGIVMKVYTDQPGMQFYSGNFMDGTDKGKRGEYHTFRSGIALETQHFPDSPNQPEFPSTVLRPGEKYTQSTKYVFSTR